MNDKAIMITGGFGVLGRAVIAALTASGARCVAVDIANAPSGQTVDAALVEGGVDGADPEAAEALVRRVVQAFGTIDGLVNIAGGFRWETVASGSVDTWDDLYRMNVRTTLVMSRAVAPAMIAGQGGAIVNVGAAATLEAGAGMGAYTASKSGVARLTEALAEELRDDHVRVNGVMPSIIDTPANRMDMPDADHARWVRPDELASVIAFLLSDAASAVTGAMIPVVGRV